MDLGLTRRNIGRLVLLAWAAALTWLARRQFASESPAAMAARATRLAPGAQFFAVYAGGRQIGQLNLAADTLVDGVRLNELLVLDLPWGDTTRQLAASTEYLLSRGLRLRSLSRTVFGVGMREALSGSMGADSILALTDVEGEGLPAGQIRFRVPREPALPGLLTYRVAFGGQLRSGAQVMVPLLDLATGSTANVPVRVTGESTFVVPDSADWDSTAGRWVAVTMDTVPAYRLEHDARGIPTVTWVDAGGAVVEEHRAGGLSYIRSAFEIVRNNYRRMHRNERSDWRRDIPGMVSLLGSGRAPDTSRSAQAWVLLPDSATGGRLSTGALEGGRQQLRGDTLVVHRATPEEPDSGARAEAADARGPFWDLPVLDGEIMVTSRRALAGAVSAEDSARRLTLWVAREIANDTTATAAGTALYTLRRRRGNADGKARLLATLARAAGIPARVVAGLAVFPGRSPGHAWVELWAGRWIAADPTFGHFPASASLVRLAVGTRSRATDLVPLAGSARFLPISSFP